VGRLVAAASRRASDGWLDTLDAQALIAAYGIAVARSCESGPQMKPRRPGRARVHVAVKLAATVHKSDIGGVRLGVATPTGAATAVQEIRADLESAGMAGVATDFLVQEQIGSGQEMIVGVNRDPLLGSLVMVGLGGTLVELLSDVAVRIAPLSDLDIDDMLGSLKSFRLLTGYRGRRLSTSTRCGACYTASPRSLTTCRRSPRWTSIQSSCSRKAPSLQT